MWMMIIKKLLKPLWGWIKKLIFSVYAVWLLPIVLIILGYLIFGKQNYSLKLIIMFCVVLGLWLSALVTYIGKAQKIPEEINELAKKFKAEFNVARSKIYTAFYEVPFFIIMGEPGAGKTTMIKSSGFSMLGTIDEKRDDEKKGVGGTRGCDWFIRKEAVFLDTAGLMSEDKDLWEAFLTKVRNVRPLYPVNGVLVVVPVDQLCHKKEKELQAGPAIPDLPEGEVQEGQFTVLPEYQYNIFGKQLSRGEEAEVKNHIREKATAIKDRLQELQDILNFHLPVYVMLSKCDLLAGFRDFSHVLSEIEKDQIVGMASYDDYDRVVEQLRQWQVKKSVDNVNNLMKSWLYLENIRVLKERLQPYHEVFTEFFGAPEPGTVPYLRGYFISSCKQHMIVQSGDSYKRSRAYFVKDFFGKKVVSEQGLGKPGEEIVSRKQLITRRIKIATLVCIIGVILWVVGYFVANYGVIAKLDVKTTELKVLRDGYKDVEKAPIELHVFRQNLTAKALATFEEFKKSRTKSILFVASYQAPEVQTHKTGLLLLHHYLIRPTLEECLERLGTQEKERWDPLVPGAVKVENLKDFVAYANDLAKVYKIYKSAREDLTGFEDLYYWVHGRKLEVDFEKVREFCREDRVEAILKEIRTQQLRGLADLEKQAIEERLKPYLDSEFKKFCEDRTSFNKCNELLNKYYKPMVDLHGKLDEAGSNAEFVDFEELVKGENGYEAWKKFAEANQFDIKDREDYKTVHELLLKRDIENNKAILAQLADNPFLDYTRMKLIYEQKQTEIGEPVRQQLNEVYLDKDYHVSLLILWLKARSSQIDTIFKLEEAMASDPGKKKDPNREIREILEKIEKFDDEEEFPVAIAYEDALRQWWWLKVNEAVQRILESIHKDYLERVGKANQHILELQQVKMLEFKKKKYKDDIDEAIGKATEKLDVYLALKEKVHLISDWEMAIVRLKDSKEMRTAGIPEFLESKGFLDIIAIPESRIKSSGSLSDDELNGLLYAIPALYDGMNDESDLGAWALSMLKKDLLQRVKPAERRVVEYWERRCSEAFAKKRWEDFHKYCRTGRDFYAIVNREQKEGDSANLFREKYQDLVKQLYEGVIAVFALELSRHSLSGQPTLRDFSIGDNMDPYWQWTQQQLGEYIKVFQEQNIPLEVLESSNNKPYAIVIANLVTEVKKQQDRQPGEMIYLQEAFRDLIIPWLKLKKDPEIIKSLSEVKLEDLSHWVGKEVLAVAHAKNLPFKQKLANLTPKDYESYTTHVFIKWDSYLKEDFETWSQTALDSLAGILKREYSKVNKKFPFNTEAGEEASLEEADEFFPVFAAVRKDYKQFLMGKREEDFDWPAFFDKCERWQSTLYGKETQFNLGEAVFIVKIAFPTELPEGKYINGISFLGDECWRLGKVKKETFNWQWGEPAGKPFSLEINFTGEATVSELKGVEAEVKKDKRQIIFKPAVGKDAPATPQWQLFRFLNAYQVMDKKEEQKRKKNPNYKRSKIKLSFPYQINYGGAPAQKTSLDLEFTISLKGQEGEFDLPWQGK